MLRMELRSYVYIAASFKGKLIKIGSTTNAEGRSLKLCADRYGGQSDWEMLSKVRTDKSGEVESKTQSKLGPHAVDGEYTHEGRTQKCYELFRCNFDDARIALLGSIQATETIVTPNLERATRVFNFR